MENLFKADVILIPATLKLGEILTYQLSIPEGYIISSFLCSVCIATNNLSETPSFSKTESKISYSYSKQGLVKIAPLVQDGLGRKVCCVAFLLKN